MTQPTAPPKTTPDPAKGRGDPPRKDKHQNDLLDESLEESFPASDPPTPKRIT